ncbi:MAG: hypothetical protein H0X30_08775 [Anaerolineae bacterium]|nr:hypothetical protein [Anaerolineae bacterium]
MSSVSVGGSSHCLNKQRALKRTGRLAKLAILDGEMGFCAIKEYPFSAKILAKLAILMKAVAAAKIAKS